MRWSLCDRSRLAKRKTSKPASAQTYIKADPGAFGPTEITISIELDGDDIFFVVNGERIAKRGAAKTPQAGQWIPLKPGFDLRETPAGFEYESWELQDRPDVVN